jgi:RNA polymerase sigma-70 factor (ECF subfamily)
VTSGNMPREKKFFKDGTFSLSVKLSHIMVVLYPTAEQKRSTARSPKSVAEFGNQSLVNGLKTGNSSAAFAFCSRYGPRINRWVWRLLGADAEHDEMVQQVYVGFFSSLSKLKNVDALDAFVDSITIRTVRKEIRKRKIRRMFFNRSGEIEIDNTSEERPLRDVYIRTFYRMLNRLSVDERTVFVLKHFEGLTTDEIAQRCGYSLRTANRRLCSGRARLKEMMMKETVLIHLLEER